MCALLFDDFKHLLLRKTDVLKTCWKNKFLGKSTFKLLCSRDKKFLSEFLGKWSGFQGNNERFPKYLSYIKISKN